MLAPGRRPNLTSRDPRSWPCARIVGRARCGFADGADGDRLDARTQSPGLMTRKRDGSSKIRSRRRPRECPRLPRRGRRARSPSPLCARVGNTEAGGRACGVDVAGNGGYSYAGHQSADRGHGVRATITATRALQVDAGHVAGWVGVGGPGQGVGGEDAWIQVGIASAFGTRTVPLRGDHARRPLPEFIPLDPDVRSARRGTSRCSRSRAPGMLARLGRRQPVTKPVKIRGSSGRWAPIATAESFSGGKVACNSFAFRFERVLVSHGPGGAWKPFDSGDRFLDGGNSCGHSRPPRTTRLAAALRAARNPLPYAFLASS